MGNPEIQGVRFYVQEGPKCRLPYVPGRRAAQGAYFDWMTGNAILPSQDLNPQHEGVEVIDRQRGHRAG